MNSQFDISVARQKDSEDNLHLLRSEFYFPQHLSQESIYFTGHSLGLQHKNSRLYLEQEFKDWSDMAVDGHFRARTPWLNYHKSLSQLSSVIIGAKHNEVVTMNGLTVNLHLLLTSFYQPSGNKYKILCEPHLFPSDLYVLRSQIELRGYNPDESIVFLPADSNGVVIEDDIYNTIESHRDELALVFLGAVNYYTGQVFDVKKITQHAHQHSILAGFDLAHAAGNIQLKLHEWNVDFAAFCSYKYLNSGPGNVSTVFIHTNQIKQKPFRLSGWWGHDEETRFLLQNKFQPINTAEGWQLSNAPIFGMSVYRSSLELFNRVGMSSLCEKRIKLNKYLEQAISYFNEQSDKVKLTIITPGQAHSRGAQLSVSISHDAKNIFNKLRNHGVYVDWRPPNIMRLSAVPLYNSYEDIAKFINVLIKCT